MQQLRRFYDCKQHGRRLGFTLLEVLVALTIAGIALAMLTAEIGTGLTNAKLSGQYIEAVRRAQSRLEIIGAQDSFVAGETDGDDGGGFNWHATISSPITRPPVSGSDPKPGMTLYDIEVMVSWQSGGTKKKVSLWSQRLRTFSG